MPDDTHTTPAAAGPFESARDAMAAVQHIYAMPPGTGAWTEANLRLLLDACRDAGVQLGAHDHRILAWLAEWEPSTVAVVAGIITRASTKSSSEGERDEPELREVEAITTDPDAGE